MLRKIFTECVKFLVKYAHHELPRKKKCSLKCTHRCFGVDTIGYKGYNKFSSSLGVFLFVRSMLINRNYIDRMNLLDGSNGN